MIRDARLPEHIETLLPRAGEYLKSRKDVSFAYLFGGLARGKPRPLSDVDIAVCLSEEKDITEKRLEILGDLMDILKNR